MIRILAIILAVCAGLLPLSAVAETADAQVRIVLTIGDWDDRTENRYDGENQLGIWQYLEDQLGVEIEYVHLGEGQYETALASGNLPDIVATNNDLSGILKAGVALNVEPYLEEYAPNLLKGDAGLAYRVIKQINHDEDGFWFIPQQIGISGERYLILNLV